MKKIICLITAALLMFSLPVYAQNRVGIIGGLNSSTFKTDDESVYESRTFIGIGGVLDLALNKQVFLRLEPMYLQKGALQTDSDPEGKVKSSYLEIPLFLKYEFGGTVKPYLVAGPSIGFLLSSEIELEMSGITFKGDLKPVYKSIDIGFGLGAGIDYPVGNLSIFLETRYTFGMSDFNKGGSTDIKWGDVSQTVDIVDSNVKNKGLQVMFGITFPFGASK
ncbi:porin family protein [candidate division KSB1 bacterium]